MTNPGPTTSNNLTETPELVTMKSIPLPLCQCSQNPADLPCISCRRINALEAEIRHVESQLGKLKRDLFTAKNESYDRFSRLPIELCMKIFAECCKPFEAHPPSATDAKQPESIAFGVAGVCRAWRDVAFSAPFLWTSISLDVCKVHADRESMLCWRFDLAGHLSISLFVYESLSTTIPYPQAPLPALEPLVHGTTFLKEFISHRINRICTLVVNLPEPLLKAFELSQIAHPYTLDEFHLHDTGKHWYRQVQPSIVFDKHLTVRNICIDTYSPAQVHANWGDVQELKVKNVGFETCLHVLVQASHISRFDIDIYGQGNEVEYPQLPLIKPTMKSLCIRNEMTATFLMRTCLMPRLMTLDIRDITGTNLGVSFPDLPNFLDHCASTLTNLNMELSADIIYDDVVSILERSPNINNLQLKYYGAVDTNASRNVLHALIERLTFGSNQPEANASSNPPLLCRLRQFKLLVEFPLNWITLAGLAASRQPSYQPADIEHLRNLDIHLIQKQIGLLDLACTRRILKLRESGCDVTFRQCTKRSRRDGTLLPDLDVVQESMKHHGIL